MFKIKVLLKGYCSSDNKGHACSTITLVQDRNLNIIIDPGTTKNQNAIIQALKKEKLKASDINVVFITHAHTDHYRNIGMFTKAKTLDYWGWWDGDTSKKANKKITKNIEIIKTPGHSDDGMTMVVKTKLGKIAICGDVYWKKDFPKKDSYANNPKLLAKSRRTILKLADYIIPGHGDIYRV